MNYVTDAFYKDGAATKQKVKSAYLVATPFIKPIQLIVPVVIRKFQGMLNSVTVLQNKPEANMSTLE